MVGLARSGAIGPERMILSSNRKLIFGLDNEQRFDALRDALLIEDLLPELGIDSWDERGAEIWAPCPFHNDSGKHWSINFDSDSDRWGLHSCFVCREGDNRKGTGNVVTLVWHTQELENYNAALDWLEEFAGIEQTEENALELGLRKRIPRAPSGNAPKGEPEENPSKLYSRMGTLEPGSPGWRYLTGRNVTPEQIAARGVKLGRSFRELPKASRGKYRGRVVFPVFLGVKVLNFYARHYGNGKPKGLYAKKKDTISRTLYGIERANKMLDTCYLVEGIFDVLAVERALLSMGKEVQNIFATLGPILYPAQAVLLRVFKTVIVIPDMKGKAKSILPTTKEQLQDADILVIEVPQESDIDDIERREPELAAQLLSNPAPAWERKITVRVDYTIRR